MSYRKEPTSAEVFAVIKARHPELIVFSTISEPDGDPFGNRSHCRMMTEYGFKDSDAPLIGGETTWQKHPASLFERVNETHKYWLCVAIFDDEA